MIHEKSTHKDFFVVNNSKHLEFANYFNFNLIGMYKWFMKHKNT